MSSWRYIARRATTGEFLDLDLPLSRDELSWGLSGPGSLRGTVAPDIGALRAPDGHLLLDEWGTILYAEADGVIRWGGLVITSKFEGGKWNIEAAGLSTYPHGIPYDGDYFYTDLDPADAVREIWSRLQAHPDGNLGVTVTGSTPSRVGTPEEPYSLVWWETPDSGTEIDDLAKAAPFDYVEHHSWAGDTISHRIEIAPRLGRRREDLVFRQGDNVISLVTPEVHGDDYANEVVGLGAGDGKAALRRIAPVRDGRLRRTYVHTAKEISNTARLDAAIAAQLRARSNVIEVSQVAVIDHPNAPIGSWSLGDDVLIEASLPWLGEVAIWHRVIGWSLVTDSIAQINLARSNSFVYGG